MIACDLLRLSWKCIDFRLYSITILTIDKRGKIIILKSNNDNNNDDNNNNDNDNNDNNNKLMMIVMNNSDNNNDTNDRQTGSSQKCREFPLINLHGKTIVAIFYPFSQFCEINISLLSLQAQPNTAPNLFQRGVEYGKYDSTT